jgi:hypothetical protein
VIQVEQPFPLCLFDGTILRVTPESHDRFRERITGLPVEKRQLALHLGQVALMTGYAGASSERLVRCTNAYKNIGQTGHVNSYMGRNRTTKYSIFFTLLQAKTASGTVVTYSSLRTEA